MAKGYIAGIGGGGSSSGGGGISPTLQDEEMVKWDDASGELVGTGDINTDTAVTFGAKDVFCNTLITEAGSIDVGPALTITDRGGHQQLTSNVDGTESLSVTYVVDDTGSQTPTYNARDPIEIRNVLLSDDSTPIIGFTGYLSAPTQNRDIHSLYFKFVNPVTNLRLRGTSVTTGEVIKYFPSRYEFNQGIGVSVAAGEQIIPLDEPFSEVAGTVINVELFADASIDVLGDGVLPWLAADTQLITTTPLVTEAVTAPESVSTSLIEGGVVTQNTTTTIDINAGHGRIVVIDGLGVPTVTPVSWDALVNVPITNILTQTATRLAFDITGTLVQLPVDLTPEADRDYINIGIVSHQAGVIPVDGIINASLKSQEVYSQFVDCLETLGVTKKNGLVLSPNADLTFNKTSGIIQVAGGGNDTGTRGQNLVRVNAETPVVFNTLLGLTDDPVATAQTSLDVGFYDAGTGIPVAIGGAPEQATIINLYQPIKGNVVSMYGQTIFSSLSEAILNADITPVDRPSTIRQDSNLIGRFAVRSDATNLQDENQAALLGGVMFGTGIDGNLSGSISGGGDVLGPASSSVDEIPTYADVTGKVIKAGSDISAAAGTLTRIAAASDIDFVDGANGTVTFTTGGISVKNPSETPKYRLTDNIDQTIGGIDLHGSLGAFVRLHRSLGEGVFKSELRMHDAYITTTTKMAIDTAEEPDGALQIEAIPTQTEGNTTSAGTPLVVNTPIDNGGSPSLAPEVIMQQWRRAGVAGESFGNIANWTIRRYELDATNSKTAVKLQMTDLGVGTDAVEDIMEWKSEGVVTNFGKFNSTDLTLIDVSENILGGVNWETALGGFTRVHQRTNLGTYLSELRLHDGYTTLPQKTAVDSIDEPNGLLQVQGKATVTVMNTSDVDTPLVVNDIRNNGGNSPNGHNILQQWRRSGVVGASYGNIANLTMARYENIGTNSRTEIKLQLKHAEILDDTVSDIVRWRSNGEMLMPTTTAAFVPPRVTTAQMNLIPPVGVVYNTDVGSLYSGDGVVWSSVGYGSSASGRVANQDGIALSGSQTIATGTVSFYEISGVTTTPTFSSGVWTIDESGVYLLNFKGYVSAANAGQVRFVAAVNSGGYDKNNSVEHRPHENSAFSASGMLRLVAGDTIHIEYSVLSGISWTLSDFVWDISKVAK